MIGLAFAQLGAWISPIDKMLSMWVRRRLTRCRVVAVPGNGCRAWSATDYRVPASRYVTSANMASASRLRPAQSPQPGPKGAADGDAPRTGVSGRLCRIAVSCCAEGHSPVSHVNRTAPEGHSFRAKSGRSVENLPRAFASTLDFDSLITMPSVEPHDIG